MTNYDVIEAYVEDFTNWNYVKARGVATISQHKFIITECILKGLSIVEDIQEPYSNLTDGAFIFEYKTPTNNKTYSYYQQNDIVIDNNNKVVYQTKNSYNGTPIYAGDKQDTDVLYIGNIRVPDIRSFVGCHGDILLFNRSLTKREISWVKNNMMCSKQQEPDIDL